MNMIRKNCFSASSNAGSVNKENNAERLLFTHSQTNSNKKEIGGNIDHCEPIDKRYSSKPKDMPAAR